MLVVRELRSNALSRESLLYLAKHMVSCATLGPRPQPPEIAIPTVFGVLGAQASGDLASQGRVSV